MNNARVQLLFQPICCVRCEQSTHTVFLYAAGALSVIKAAAAALPGEKGVNERALSTLVISCIINLFAAKYCTSKQKFYFLSRNL
jgi:hypothetical protein